MPEGTEGAQGASQDGGQGQQQNNGGQQPGQESGQQQATPPWERNGEQFDPEKAWNLIQSLRNENGTLKSDREALQGKVTEFEQQGLTEVEKLTNRATTAEQERDTAAGELVRLQVALNNGLIAEKDGKFVLDEDAMKLLGTGTAEELEERAKLIAARSGQQQQTRGFNHGPAGQAPKGDMNSLIFGAMRK